MLEHVATIAMSFTFCERDYRFCRPNLPEKHCAIGISDVDDTTDYTYMQGPLYSRKSAHCISFEKSYQMEYTEEANDSIREFSFSLSSSDKVLFNFKSDTGVKSLRGYVIPKDIDSRTSEKYNLDASEKDLLEISAENEVPPISQQLELISVKIETVLIPDPIPCTGFTTARAAVIDFSFENVEHQKSYYVILLAGHGLNESSTWPVRRSQLEFDIRYCNTPGFFAVLNGFTRPRWKCLETRLEIINLPVYANFIEGDKNPGDNCVLKTLTQFEDERSPFNIMFLLRVRILSILKALYQFEESLYNTHQQTVDDPFTEPIYLIENIIRGENFFAVCCSRVLSVEYSPWY